MSFINCDAIKVACDPSNVVNPCNMCQNDENYICAKVNDEFQCIRKRVIDHNPFLEYVVINPSDNKINYICRYPQFISNNNNPEEQCKYIHGCAPTGKLLNKNGDVITNTQDIKSLLSNYRCDCGDEYVSFFLEFPRCKMANVQDLLNNLEKYKNNPCLGYPEKELLGKCDCPDGYIYNKNEAELRQSGYKSTIAYDLTLLPKTCIKKPCQFDPITGDYLNTFGFWNPDIKSCQCSVSRGLLGIFINEAGNGNAVDVANDKTGYNACLKIHVDDSRYYGYMRQYVAPKGIPELMIYTNDFDDSKFLTVYESLKKYFEEHDDESASKTKPCFSSVYNDSLNQYAKTFKFEYPLDLSNKLLSVDKTRPISFDKDDSLFIKLDDTYDHPFYKKGDIVRNPNTYNISNVGTVINEFLAIVDNTVAILNYNSGIKNTDLISLPQKKKK